MKENNKETTVANNNEVKVQTEETTVANNNEVKVQAAAADNKTNDFLELEAAMTKMANTIIKYHEATEICSEFYEVFPRGERCNSYIEALECVQDLLFAYFIAITHPYYKGQVITDDMLFDLIHEFTEYHWHPSKEYAMRNSKH